MESATKRRILLHILCWVLLKGYELIFYTSGSSFDYAYRNAFSRLPAELLLYYAGVIYILPAFFENRNLRKLMTQLLVALAIATIAYRIGRYYFFPQARIADNFWQTLAHIPSFFVAPFYFISIPALGFIIFIFSKLQKNELQKKEAEKQRMIAEVNLLKSQIQPHFLFNTLNNLYGLALVSSTNTADSIMRLSKIMEYMLYNSEREFVPIGMEMQYIRDYIELEKLRYGKRLQVSFDIDDSLFDKSILPLVLFPFVENAFKHGSGKEEGDTWISISLLKENSTIVYVVVNSISSTGKAIETTQPGGYGLQNLHKRLQFGYAGKYKLEQMPGESSYMSVLKLDL